MAWLVVLRRLPKPEDCTDAEPRETLTKLERELVGKLVVAQPL